MTPDQSAVAAVLAAAPEPALILDARGHVLDGNAAAERVLRTTSAELAQHDLWHWLVVGPQERRGPLNRLRPAPLKQLVGQRVRADGRRADRSTFAADVTVAKLETAGKAQYVAWLRDRSAAHETDRARRDAERRLQALSEQEDVAMLVVDRDLRLTSVSGGALAALSLAGETLTGARLEVAAAHLPAVVTGLRRAAAGEPSTVRFELAGVMFAGRYAPVRDDDGHPSGALAVVADITREREADAAAAELAFRDQLTGLLNRRGLERALHPAARTADIDDAVAVLHAGLDDFKLINESLGRAAGDELLRETAERLREALGEDALLARQGGDEYTIVLEHLDGDGEAAARAVAEDLLRRFEGSVEVAGTHFFASVSIGIALAPRDRRRAPELLREAESAMRAAKASGRGALAVAAVAGIAPGADDPRERLRLSTRLHGAISGDELRLHFQPIFWLAEGHPYGVEALLRWEDPDRGMIPPGAFLEVAEGTGLIEPIGAWVVEELCRQAQGWRTRGVTPQVHLNVSPRQLRAPEFAAHLLETIGAHGLPAGSFAVEVPEAAFGDADRTVPVLDEIHRAGVKVAIDGFGAGHSSLTRLKDLPVDILKLDRRFLADIPRDPGAGEVVSALLALAEALGKRVIAQGIETEGQRAFLLEKRCALGQGYRLGRPAPAREGDTPRRTAVTLPAST